MTLTDVGESRVNGYLFVLERSLSAFLPREAARDAVREIESHIRERVAGAEAGPPLRVAQAYSVERTIDEAVATGRFVPTLRAIWQMAAMTVRGFFVGLGLLIGYLVSFGFFAIAALKPIFPNNVGIQFIHGIPVGLGAHFPVTPDLDLRGGYWIIPLAVVFGLGLFVATHRAARRFLASFRRTPHRI
jgi:uncharacterized membrane protein